MSTDKPIKPYRSPAGGWGSLKAVAGILMQEHVAIDGSAILSHQNKPDGFACVSCSWAKPADPHLFEFCENGAKATAWEITSKHIDADFFSRHTLTELESWTGLELESSGRLTAPMRWEADTDQYVQTTWQEAFEGIARELRGDRTRRSDFLCVRARLSRNLISLSTAGPYVRHQ